MVEELLILSICFQLFFAGASGALVIMDLVDNKKEAIKDILLFLVFFVPGVLNLFDLLIW